MNEQKKVDSSRVSSDDAMNDHNKSLEGRELENLMLLRGLDAESIRGILERCSVHQLRRGEILIHAEKPNESLFVLLSGSLRVHLKLDLDPITFLEPGEIVGELSLIDKELTSAHVVADEDSRVLIIDEQTMWSLIDASPVARNLLFVFARRLRETDSVLTVSQQLQREYQQYAVTDALTGLYNRRWLDNMLERQMDRYKQSDKPLSLLMIDVDHFKSYNDNYGHLIGDRVLYTVAQTLQENLRPGEIIVRYAGDEFVVLLPDSDASSGQTVGERVRNAVKKARITGSESNSPLQVTISVGVAQMEAQDTPDKFIESADLALYKVKEEGGNQVAVRNPG